MEIDLNNIEMLYELQQHFDKTGIRLNGVVVDSNGLMNFGNLEKIVHTYELGSKERDIVFSLYGPLSGYRFDSEVSQLYIFQINKLYK